MQATLHYIDKKIAHALIYIQVAHFEQSNFPAKLPN
jgi:hypothetical protein